MDIPDLQMLERPMQAAIDRALEGVRAGQTPFAAAVVDSGGEVLAVEHNRVAANHDPSAHAEVLAIRAAASARGQPALDGCWLISTCEPCPMCAAAIVFANIRQVAIGAPLEIASRAGYPTLQVPVERIFSHAPAEIVVVKGVLRESCERLLRENPGDSLR